MNLYPVWCVLREATDEGLTAEQVCAFTGADLWDVVPALRDLVNCGLAAYVPHGGRTIRVRALPLPFNEALRRAADTPTPAAGEAE